MGGGGGGVRRRGGRRKKRRLRWKDEGSGGIVEEGALVSAVVGRITMRHRTLEIELGAARASDSFAIFACDRDFACRLILPGGSE